MDCIIEYVTRDISENMPVLAIEERPAIKAVQLSKQYGSTLVLSNLDLTVHWGEFLTVFGLNGSGKTTLMRLLSTLVKPTSGDLDVATYSAKSGSNNIRREVGVVAHQPLLYKDLTARENLRFHGKMFAIDNINMRIESVAHMLGVESQMDIKVGTLSHGQQKRVAIARAILHDPSILLLDEPETGLDQEGISMLKNIVVGERGIRTVIMSTHNLDHGLELATRVAILTKGSIAYDKLESDISKEEFRDVYTSFTGVGN